MLPCFNIFTMHKNQTQSDCPPQPPGVLLHITNFLTTHITHTHTLTGWPLTGTNALMALSYILGTRVSVGYLAQPL